MAVLEMGGLVAVGPPGTQVSVGPGLVEEGETSRDGVVVWVNISGRDVPVTGGGILVGG